jgi:uncharacterized membrane-anchored protein YitT (DUF2179 family)
MFSLLVSKPQSFLLRDAVSDAFFITVGVLSATLGLKGFLLPNSFIDGGVTGISLLVSELTSFPLPILIFAINVPFVFMGLRQNGRMFALKTLLAILGLALAVFLIDVPVITRDKMLVSVFGGFFLGTGIGLAIRGGSVIDGTEVLSLYLNKRTALTIGDIILLINMVIFSAAALLLGMETALYSILTYLAASKTVDFIIQGIEEYTGVIIISGRNDEIRNVIISDIGRGITTFKGRKGYGKKGEKSIDQDILFTVITRLEVPRLKKEIEKIDREAFVVTHSINEIKGGMIKKHPFHAS